MKPIITTKIALDTNVILYSHSVEDTQKRLIAQKLLTLYPIISGQVISEYLNVMKRLFPISKTDLMHTCAQWIKKCVIHPIDSFSIETAEYLIRKYDFQIFDGIIVASALNAGCDVLFSEDMQHELLIEKQMKIVNPFL